MRRALEILCSLGILGRSILSHERIAKSRLKFDCGSAFTLFEQGSHVVGIITCRSNHTGEGFVSGRTDCLG